MKKLPIIFICLSLNKEMIIYFWRSQSHNFATNFCNLSNLDTFLPFKKDKK